MRYEGGCLCGRVRYAAVGPPLNERVCHCRTCQRALGASFNARLLFRAGQVAVSGPVTLYPSSPELLRGFCATCGTTLLARRDGAGTVAVTAGSLDDPGLFRPTEHIWTGSRQRWLAEDALVEHAGASPG